MWAGIWIDGNLADVAHYLQAIAEGKTPTTPPPATNITPANRTETPQPPVTITAPAKHTVAAVITARSSGHCEILAPGCRLHLEAIASRARDLGSHELPDAAAGYAVCRSCQAAVDRMEPRLSYQLGYLVDNPANAAAVPFYWRQTRWLRLDSAGGAVPCSSAQRSA